MSNLELTRFSITDEQLSQMPIKDAVVLMQMAYLSNTLDALQNLFVCTMTTKDDDDEVMRDANATMHNLVARVLAGVVFDAWQVFGRSFFDTGLSMIDEPKLKEEGKNALAEVTKYFGRRNLIKGIGEKLWFHCDPDEIRSEIKHRRAAGMEHVFFLGPQQGYSLFHAAESIVSMAMVRSVGLDVGEDSAEVAYADFHDEVTTVARQLCVLAHHCVAAILNKHFPEGGSTVTATGIPRMDEVRIPYFVVAPPREMPWE